MSEPNTTLKHLSIKGVVHPKMTILPLFTHPQVIFQWNIQGEYLNLHFLSCTITVHSDHGQNIP